LDSRTPADANVMVDPLLRASSVRFCRAMTGKPSEAGNDSIIGGGGNDSVNGNLGNDIIVDASGNNSLRGGQGDDSITGGTGNDIILGDLGNDTVSGGAGVDVLTGGDGPDVFAFAGATDSARIADGTTSYFYDTITDFTDGSDKVKLLAAAPAHVLHLTGATYAGTPAGVAAALAAAQTALTAGADTDVVAVSVGSDTFLFYDGAGLHGTIDSFIKVSGVADTVFTTADFV